MSLLDMQTLFSNRQEVKTSAASENVLLLAKGILKEVSFGEPLPLLIQVVEAFAGCKTLEVEVQTSADENFTTPVTLVTSGAIPVADLKAGYRFPINFIPKGNLGYMRLYYKVIGTGEAGAGAATAGKIDAGIVAGHGNSYHDM